ncbi:centromere protein Chl4/mis15/CENP-N [Amylocarpus encephaloides]|uniref:Centromere protein Chl4/mis15/CENP-N n=1 Tax=Amylocarpus encephaloides TaxID=45428 RepID=A0A9P7YPG9_9HELO|nr:centromere protein Chl4/mis15/CENP-N [Amylocarpus encephaloides]
MSSLSIPTTSALLSLQLIPSSHPTVIKTLTRLSRPSLLSLALDWLDERNIEITAPYLADEEEEDPNDLYPPAHSLDALRGIYSELQAGKGTKRDVVDRVLEGDWREGINLYQLAMADMQYLYDHQASQKWTALRIVRLSSGADDTESTKLKSIPRFHPATFLRNLKREVLPDVKAHYNLDRHPTLPLLILRIFIVESPYNTSLALTSQNETTLDSNKVFYVAFPDESPFVYVSLNTSLAAPNQPISRLDTKSLRKLTLEGIAKAFSRPRERYKLESTHMSARNLTALVERRGGGRTNAAGGGWSIYASEKDDGSDNPLNMQLPTPTPSTPDKDDSGQNLDEENKENRGLKRRQPENERLVKRRKMVAGIRFGNIAKADDGKGIEQLTIRIIDPFPSSSGAHVLPDPLADELGALDPPPKKSKGRRSTIHLELEQDMVDDGEEDEFRPTIDMVFSGSHVFAGIRELVEAGVVDGERMPGWMTGEEGVSLGVVRQGRVRGWKGSGL